MSRRRKPDRERNFTVIEGEGRKTSPLKRAAVFYLLLGLVAVLVFQAGYHWLGAQVLARRLQVVAAEPGHMDNIIKTGGIIARSEKVVRAPCDGVILEMAPPGERVAAGELLVELAVISPAEIEAFGEAGAEPEGWWEILKENIDGWLNNEEEEPEGPAVFSGEIPPWHTERAEIRCEEPGLLSYHLDGWEALEGPVLQALAAGGEQPEPSVVEMGSIVEAGQPVLKIVDNWQWSYHVSLPLDPGRTAAAQETVTVVFDFAPDFPVAARLEESVIDAEQGEVRLSYGLGQQLPGFDQARLSEAAISFQRLNGLIIPETALIEQEGEIGVFINSGGTVIFAPVTTLRLQEGRALVEGIEPFSLVIGNPELVREGQRLD